MQDIYLGKNKLYSFVTENPTQSPLVGGLPFLKKQLALGGNYATLYTNLKIHSSNSTDTSYSPVQ